MAFKLGLATLAFGAMLLGSSTSFAADWRGPTRADAQWGGQQRYNGGWDSAPQGQAFRYDNDDAKTRRFMGCRGPNCNYGPMPRPVDSRGRYELQTVERWVPARYEQVWVPEQCVSRGRHGRHTRCTPGYYDQRYVAGGYQAVTEWVWVPYGGRRWQTVVYYP
ncbi:MULTISPECIES: hypothetical protein [unclassified Corallococcus]|uniref:hypothetical protein n=1 Tax=unclassified Corallococcus TaxID=2685029 RepID=UPI001A8E350B|nr:MULTISPECIES: hypothetical protein [unclassified Corallococcus]MBN9682047.1 hypothetical protein [Corallococcus sp. NCSPR001]WAS86390.1 hypothetical protein O0N60_05305 [Corallococcus sp. NCRR]